MTLPKDLSAREMGKFAEDGKGQPAVQVVYAEHGTVKSGELQGSATALRMPDISCKLVKFKSVSSNAGNVYIGASAVTVVDGTTDATSGFELSAGDESGWIPITNLNLFYRICDNAGDDLTYLALL